MNSSHADTTNAALEHLETMANFHPDLAAEYKQIADLFTLKLWHQLTVALLSFVGCATEKKNTLRETPDGTSSYLALYDRVVLACDSKLNQLSLAQIASAVASSLASSSTNGNGKHITVKDSQAARAVLENLLEKRTRLGSTAALYLEAKLVLLTLQTIQPDQYEAVNETLKKGSKVLAQEMESESSNPIVYSAYYQAASAYRKLVGPPEAFYREAFMYLNYTPIGTYVSMYVQYV